MPGCSSPLQRRSPQANRATTFGTLSLLFPPYCRVDGSSDPLSNDTSETQVACRRVQVFRMTSRWAVAAAVIRCAQMRAAFDDFARDFALRLQRVVASFLVSAARVYRNAARLRRIGLVLVGPPISGPLPDVADHVVNAIAVRRKAGTGEVRSKPSSHDFRAESSLPGIGHMPAAGSEFVAPGEFGAVNAATGGEFLFGFGRQLLACPPRVGECIAKRHMHHWMIIARVDVALRPVRLPPVSTLGKAHHSPRFFRSTACDGGEKTSEPA